MFAVRDVNRGVRPLGWQRPCWCAPGGAGWRCREVLIGQDLKPLNVGAAPLPAPMFQTLCWIRVRSVWSVRSSACVSRGRGAVQSGCDRRQYGHDHKFAMHGLQNQCSCSVPPQPRSSPRSGAPFLSFTSQQTPHGPPGHRCGASPSGILRRGIVRGTIGRLYGRECARSGVVRRGRWCDGSCLAVAECPCA